MGIWKCSVGQSVVLRLNAVVLKWNLGAFKWMQQFGKSSVLDELKRECTNETDMFLWTLSFEVQVDARWNYRFELL